MNDRTLLKIMDLTKTRLRFLSDLNNHTYFFTEPDFESETSLKFIKKSKKENGQIL